MVVAADRIVSQRRDAGDAITALQSGPTVVAVGQNKTLGFYSLREDRALEKDGFANGLDGKVLTIDLSKDEK